MTRSHASGPASALVVVLLAGAPFLLASRAAAQEVREPVPHQQVISANPFLLLFEWFNVEWERKLGASTTLALGGSLVSLDDGDHQYRSVSAALRYYPQNAALSGFYVGPRIGVFDVEIDPDDSETVFGLGFELGYQWLLGAERRFSLSMGLGVTRLFGGELDDEVEVTIPSIRLVNIGWAF